MHDPETFVANTTIHGIKDFTYIKKPYTRLIWALFVGLCLGIMIYEMRLVTLEYLHKPTATQMTQNFRQSYDYPRILFCPRDWINATKVSELGISKPILSYALSLLPDLVLGLGRKTEAAIKYRNLSELSTDFENFLINSGFISHSEFYITIAKNVQSISTCDNCRRIGPYLTSAGVCISLLLNPMSAAQLIQSNPLFRFVDIEYDERLLPKYSSAYTTDILYVSYRATRDFFCYNPILLNRNFSYVLRITPLVYQRMDTRARPCVSRQEAAKTKYSQSDCYFQCNKVYQRQCQQDCRFLDNQNGIFLNDTTAGNDTKPYCSTLLNTAYSAGKCAKGDQEYEEFNECVMNCEPLCDEWVYDATVIPISQRRLYVDQQEADITISFSYQVQYGETAIAEVSTYTWDRFLSNVGGQLGLWMGASIVSVVQLTHFLIRYSCEKCRRSGKRKVEDAEVVGDLDREKRLKNKSRLFTVDDQMWTHVKHF